MSGKMTDDIIMKVGQGIMRIPRNRPQNTTDKDQVQNQSNTQKRESSEKQRVSSASTHNTSHSSTE